MNMNEMMKLIEETRTEKILVVVDMQNDFIDGALGSEQAASIVENVLAKVEEYAREGDYIIFTKDTHSESTYKYTEESKYIPEHCIKGTRGWEIYEGLLETAQAYEDDRKANDPEYASHNRGKIRVLEKSAFGCDTLYKNIRDIITDNLLPAKICRVVFDIEFVGLCTDICVINNAMIAAMTQDHIIVDAACCAGTSEEAHDIALAALRGINVEVRRQGEEPWRRKGEQK
jgi:nicotinamidase-related amidase